MSELARRLAEPSPLVLDGGLGSMLLARGLPAGEAPERWNLERPAELEAVHRAYVEAGSEAIHTSSFGASTLRLAAFGLEGQHDRINRVAVELARRAGPRFVLADVGPTGAYLPPVGHGDAGAMRRAFVAQGRVLADAGADGFHVETMSDLREARIALDALHEAAPGLPVLVSLTFERKRRGFFTLMGDRLVSSLVELGRAGAAAVGANCTLTSHDMADLVDEAWAGLRAAGLAVPLVAQPNAGQPLMTASGARYEHDPAAFAADGARMVLAGARLVGGCCGTEPGTIAALVAALSCAVEAVR